MTVSNPIHLISTVLDGNVNKISATESRSHSQLHIPEPSVLNKKKDDDDEDDDDHLKDMGATVTAATMYFPKVALQFMLGTTLVLYVMNQKNLLPKPMSSIVSRALFWPTLPVTLSTRIGKWITPVDDVLVLGGAPFGFLNIPETLHESGVRGIVNMCDEYAGPTKKYDKLGMRHIRLKTVDHFEPSVYHLKEAIAFMKEHERERKRVYVHCRAGHGRSGAVALAWLMYENPNADPEQLNRQLCSLRNVRKKLWKQPNIKTFHSWLKRGGRVEGNDKNRSRTRDGKAMQSERNYIDDEYSNSEDIEDNSAFSSWQTMKEATDLDFYQDRSELDDGSSSDFGFGGDTTEDERDYQLWKKYQEQHEKDS
mmetsp:Transcript_45975/g.67845  ORF Transcript_45975/g.67845 Transcript_45975/m.67845 type:complete len:367 (-) Transcript_45975:199-1299(-)|eukprot:CAMPEP_0195522316 /NCGR_PEP_ID=MMETSP0794_2-20130614/20376_1 /TAXON_ID=515487 /ORGANISM="Stephanopyxis turris, Strain CCMP 815" /LENGTH=366 /DNA_ID=CAMNT_0040652045 /DNA_START=59 /DNA_END=1159 /DNA_ORIENTATION=-